LIEQKIHHIDMADFFYSAENFRPADRYKLLPDI